MPMADPLHPPQTAHLDPERELPERATPSSLGHIPHDTLDVEPNRSNPRLNSAAESVGRALGTAVSGVRSVPDKMQEAKQRFIVIRGRKGEVTESAKERLENIAEEARRAGEDFAAKARERGEEVLERAREAGENLKEQAQVRLLQARTRVKQLSHDYPLHFVAGAAVFGALLGVVLRVWRDHAS